MKGKNRFSLKVLFVVAFVSVLAGVALTVRLDMTGTTGAQDFWKESPGTHGAQKRGPDAVAGNFVSLAEKLSPLVVNISTTQTVKERPSLPFPEFKGPFDDFFGDDLKKFFENGPHKELKRQSLGSGFIINKEGYILTNNHVIENATEIIVTLSGDKKDYTAEVIGQDQKLDAALIKIDADGDLPVAVLGDSDDLKIGEWVVAIGNPFGLGGSVTAGIVSQKGRVIGAGPYDNFIQTDASINPGNSGGPLFNTRGEVVGINTAIIAGGQGIGFATPINMVKEVLTQLKERGKVTRGWIGVSIQELTPELARSFGLKDAEGALVSSVNTGDPAEKAGLKAGDVITSFNGKPISDLSDLPRTVAATTPGETVEVKVVRDGKEKTFSITVGTRADEEQEASTPEKETTSDERFGLSVQPLTPEMAKRRGLDETEGVVISSVAPDSPAMAAGLRRGDVIKEIDRKPVTSVSDYNKYISEADGNDVVLLRIVRGSSTLFVVIKGPKAK